MATLIDPGTRAEPFRPLVRSAEVFTGFRWLVVRADGEPWGDEALLAAVYDALRSLASPGATPHAQSGLARQLAGVADKISRSARAMRSAICLNLFTDNMAEPSGRLAYLHLMRRVPEARGLAESAIRDTAGGSAWFGSNHCSAHCVL